MSPCRCPAAHAAIWLQAVAVRRSARGWLRADCRVLTLAGGVRAPEHRGVLRDRSRGSATKFREASAYGCPDRRLQFVLALIGRYYNAPVRVGFCDCQEPTAQSLVPVQFLLL